MKDWRIHLLALSLFLIAFILISRLFFLQILEHDFYKELAENQHQIHRILSPERGEIFIKDRFFETDPLSQLFSLAVNKESNIVYAVPREIMDKDGTVDLLAPILEIEKEELMAKIDKRSDPYESLKHKVSDEVVAKIEALGLEGIKFDTEKGRFFPAGSLASHITGFVGFANDQRTGQYGVEGYYNKELEGNSGFLESEKDNKGRLIAVAKRLVQPAEDGLDLILTIDPNIQFFIEKKLKELNERLGAEGGTVIVSDPRTGAIKGLANLPTFDPNEYSEVEDMNVFLNPAIHNVFEPGSIFKPITVAIAIEKKLIMPTTTFKDEGFIKIGGTTIRNSHDEPEGIQTMAEVLEKSLNTGIVFIQQLIAKDTFKKYLEKFGFDSKTGIDLGGEVRGDLSNLKTKRDLEYATASFGQGIAVTSVELVVALSSIANEGRMMTPYLVEEFRNSDGEYEKVKPKPLERVISAETAETLTKMMVGVVENGFGSKAKIPGYFIAGKTGTAQVPDPEMRGYSDKTIHTFGGFFPAFEPRFFVLVKLDNPKTIRFAADSVVPLFREITKYILDYYEIAPAH